MGNLLSWVCLTFLHGLEYGGPFYVGYNMLCAGLDYAGLSHCLLYKRCHFIIIIIDCFYIALFSALEQTQCTRM